MAFTVELRKPTQDSKGVGGFYYFYPEAAKVLLAWQNNTAPTRDQLDALITCICFFVPDELKAETRRQLLFEATIADLVRVIAALPQLARNSD